jgi:MSHA biogenesis protein MshN
MPTWLVGIGISLQALGQNRDAQEAFTRARDGGLLSPPLLSFVEQRLRQLP